MLPSGGSGLMTDSLKVEKLVDNLKATIDLLGLSFSKAKDQILELARTLDESKQCQRNRISIKIKQLLQDKINEGKITSKWIHDCLPSEYKREYSKREVTSLSTEGDKAEHAVELSPESDGTTLMQGVGSDDNNSSCPIWSSAERKLPLDSEPRQHQFQSTPANNIDRNLSSVSSESQQQQDSVFVVFEFFMQLEDLRRYLEPIYRETAGRGNAWFHGTFDVRTGRVTDVSTGRAVSFEENGEGTL